MKAMRELPPMEFKDTCDCCHGTGRLYFNTEDELIDYIENHPQSFDQHLAPIQQFQAEGFIDCDNCRGKGFKTVRL